MNNKKLNATIYEKLYILIQGLYKSISLREYNILDVTLNVINLFCKKFFLCILSLLTSIDSLTKKHAFN